MKPTEVIETGAKEKQQLARLESIFTQFANLGEIPESSEVDILVQKFADFANSNDQADVLSEMYAFIYIQRARGSVERNYELSRFVEQCVATMDEQIAAIFLNPQNWEQSDLILDGFKLLSILQKSRRNHIRVRGREIAEKVLTTVIDHISQGVSVSLLLKIQHFFHFTFLSGASDEVADRLLNVLSKQKEPTVYLLFLYSGNEKLFQTIQRWFFEHMQERCELTFRQSEELMDRWARSHPKSKPLTFLDNYKAIVELEGVSPGATQFLINKNLVFCFNRYPISILEEQVDKLKRNELARGEPDQEQKTPRKTVNFLVLTTPDDHNGVVYGSKDRWDLLHRQMKKVEVRNHGNVVCNLMVLEYDNPLDLLHTLEKWSEYFGSFDGLIEQAHGSQETVFMKSSSGEITSDHMKRLLVGQLNKPVSSYLSRFMACFKPIPKFVLHSCSVGAGSDSFAENLSKVNAEVYASNDTTRGMYINFGFNRVMRLDPQFVGGDSIKFFGGTGVPYQASDRDLLASFAPAERRRILRYLKTRREDS